MTNLADTSIPSWFVGSVGSDDLDATGSSHLLVGVGDAASPVIHHWRDVLRGHAAVEVVIHDDVPTARAALIEALHRSWVGLRVWLTGPAGACLALRAAALNAGMEDDEITVVAAGIGPIEVFCPHCQANTAVLAQVGDAVDCTGCHCKLVVYYHVSRRSGRFLGRMIDAEQAQRQ